MDGRGRGLGAVLAAGVLALAGCTTSGSSPAVEDRAAEWPLAIPELMRGTPDADGVMHYDLTAQAGTTDFGVGGPADTIGLNGSYLGPTLLMENGTDVAVHLTNSLDEMTTLHWHGMHVPARMDGGPHQMIQPGDTWHPRWTIDQPAASLWYHSHPHGETAQQVYRGLAGMLLIEDPAARADSLPHRYGVDDLPLVVQDKTFDEDGSLVVDPRGRASTGFLGDTIVVNGTVAPYQEVTTQAVRLRLLNASNARFYDFAMSDGRDVAVVAGDGGLLAHPVTTDHVQLSPGERAEVVVRFAPGETASLISRPPDLGHGIGTSDRFGGGTFDVVQFRAAQQLAPSPEPAADLADVPPPDTSSIATTRRFGITDVAINGRPMDMSRIDEVVTEGDSEIWEVTNQNPQPHNFHVHDGSFRVLSIDGDPPPAEMAGYKDTVYVAPRSTVRILVRFSDYTDPTWPYMFHCHLLLHEDMGVMGQFVVIRPGDTVQPPPAGRGLAGGHSSHEDQLLRSGG
jgi:suppressor of ftsI